MARSKKYIIPKVIEALKQGYTLEKAGEQAGINTRTLRRWRSQDPALNEKIIEANEEGRCIRLNEYEDILDKCCRLAPLNPRYQKSLLAALASLDPRYRSQQVIQRETYSPEDYRNMLAGLLRKEVLAKRSS
jgi:transposase-like protein